MFKFLREYIKNPNYIGAFAPSSHYLAKEMVSSIDFDNSKCIVEYGPGTGVFTDELIKRRKKGTRLLLIEQNKSLYIELLIKYQSEENIEIINDSAENINDYISKYGISNVDYIVSGLPFTSLPPNVSDTILKKTQHFIKNGGSFITFQYTMLKKSLFEKYFNIKNRKYIIRNMPPAHVLVLSHKK